MATTNFRYLGNHCGTIFGFLLNYPGYQMDAKVWANLQVAIAKDIADNANLGLLAITADYYQSHAHDLLKTNGFRKVFVFKSSHNNDIENLTVWVKENKNAKDVKYGNPEAGPHNCSVTYGHPGSNPRLSIVTTKPTDPAHGTYRKIRGVNVWYKIDPKYVVKT